MNNTINRREMLLSQSKNEKFSRLDLIVRKSFLDSLNTQEYEFYRNLYTKMQYNRTGHTVHTNRLPWVEQFLILDRSFYKKGYIKDFPLIVNEDKHLINSSHRASLCLHHNIDSIPYLICKEWKDHLETTGSKTKTYFDYGEDWFLKNGFFDSEMKAIEEKKYELFENLNMFFYFILWPPCELYFNEIRQDLEEDYKIMSNKKIKINNLNNFIKRIYKIDNISEWKLNKKIESINLSTNSKNVMILKIDLFNTKFRQKTNFPNEIIAIEAEKIKKTIRNKYKTKIKNYFHDIIIHASDNYDHVDYIKEVLNDERI